MSRSIRAAVVAVATLTAAVAASLTMSSAEAARPEPVTFKGAFVGGAADDSIADAVTGPDGSTYLAMFLTGGDFPADPGGYRGGWDALVVKQRPNGSTAWATTIGGAQDEDVRAIALGPDGDVVVVGRTSSLDFPTTPGALKSTNTLEDGYVVKLDGATGATEWSTLIGGTGREELLDVTIGADNRVWVVGDTQSWNYPTTELADGTFQGTGEAVLSQFSPTGALQYSTMYGDHAYDVLVSVGFGPDGRLFSVGGLPDWTPSAPSATLGDVDGDDAVLLRWTVDGAKPVLEHATFFGGQGGDYATAMGVDRTGAVVIAGYTWKPGMPLVHAFQTDLGADDSAFVAKIDPTGEQVLWSTYYGGSGTSIYPLAVRTDTWGNTYIGGSTKATDGQQLHAVQGGNAGGIDGFVAKIAADGRLVFSTYLGGTGNDTVAALDLDRTGVRFAGAASGPTFAGLGKVSGPRDGIVGHLVEVAHVTAIKGKAKTADRTPTFKLTVDLAGSRTQCRVDSRPWQACATTFTSAKLKPGKHVLQARALSGPGRKAPVAKRAFQVSR